MKRFLTKTKKRGGVGFRTAALLLAGLWTAPILAGEELTPLYHQTRGGRLYDNWYATLKVKPPKENHASYPATGTAKGSVTWRCKECHGWDYKGVDGRYKQGSDHYTGIKGIRAMVGKEAEAVKTILRDATHRYTPDLLPEDAVADLALFVTKGQVDMDQAIDPATKRSLGDAQTGAVYYQTICAYCHGLNGKRFNFGSDKEPEYIGTAANDNPWEVLHKIRNGEPGQEMINMGAFELAIQSSILAYEQTLPVK